MMVTEAVVLAGGFGTRLRSVVSDMPKPMAPVNGRPFLEHLLEYWIGQGVKRFVLSIGFLAGKVVDHFGNAWRGAEIAYAHETSPLGTGGGLLLGAAETRADEILVLNGDTFFAMELPALVEFHRSRRSDCTLSLFRTQDAERYMGLELGSGGELRTLAAKQGGLANGGVYLFRSAVLQGLPWQPGTRFSLETDMLPHGHRSGWRIYGREGGSTFIDIGVPEDYRRAAEVLKR
ncbi:MAG: phosphohexose mutase [Betaproteobacteria bacterium]|nr:phosphohexose mutase [Betaproteobacteria bacterium]